MSQLERIEGKIESCTSALNGWKDHEECETKHERIKDLSNKIEALNEEKQNLTNQTNESSFF